MKTTNKEIKEKEERLLSFKKEVEGLHDITDAEEYARRLALLYLDNGLSLQTILLMAIDFGQQHPQWIPVEERLPEFVYPVGAEVKNTSEYVLAYNGYTMYISRLVGGKIHWWEDNSELVPTHWMPLPEAPKKGSEQCVK